MKIITKTLLISLLSILFFNCSSQKDDSDALTVVYQSDDLTITQISENTFEHTSFLQTQDFGKVPCNGLIVRNHNEAIVFDATDNDESSEELIKWIEQTLNCKINAIIATHFHDDCLGGLNAFHENDIPSYAYFKTIEFAQENKRVIPQNSFRDSLILKVGSEDIRAKFFGEGHTKDNVIGYFPAENILFGGCLIKEVQAGKGNLEDANEADWSNTVEKVKREYPNVKLVVPGHGKYGGKELLDYTINLFKIQ